MVMTCFYIRIDRENAIALRESRKNGEEDEAAEGKKGGKKVADEDDEKENAAAVVEESDDDDDTGDGKFFKKMRRGGMYVLKCRCFDGATSKNMVTIIFGVLMIINAILKVIFLNNINSFMLDEELSASYIKFDFYLQFVDIIVNFDILIYMMLIAVMINVIFSWLPNVFGNVVALLSLYFNMRIAYLWLISIGFTALFAFFTLVMNSSYMYGMYSFGYSLTRMLNGFSNGFIYDTEVVVFGVKENLETSLESHSVVPFLMQTIAFQLIF